MAIGISWGFEPSTEAAKIDAGGVGVVVVVVVTIVARREVGLPGAAPRAAVARLGRFVSLVAQDGVDGAIERAFAA